MVNKPSVLVNSMLLDIRLCFHAIAFLHLFFLAVVTLTIDTTVDDDVQVKAYMHVRWKLLTCWYNLINLGYLPLCIYASYKQRRGFGHARHVQRIQHLTDVCMTSILFPISLYGGILFWVLMTADPSLIGPPKVFSYLPNWCQHSLHTLPIARVLLDLMLTPRSRPKSLVPRFLIAIGFAVIYTLMVYISHQNGEIIYNLFERFGALHSVSFIILSYIIYISFFLIQWKMIDLVWRPETMKQRFKKKL